MGENGMVYEDLDLLKRGAFGDQWPQDKGKRISYLMDPMAGKQLLTQYIILLKRAKQLQIPSTNDKR